MTGDATRDNKPDSHHWGGTDEPMEDEYAQHAREEREKAKAEKEGTTVQPVPLSIRREGDQIRVHGCMFDITMLRVIGEYKTDRAALGRIQKLWGCDRDTAKVLLHAAREGWEEHE